MPNSPDRFPGNSPDGSPDDSAGRARRGTYRVTLGAEGPLLVPGPVEVRLHDGTVATSDRFTVAICTCRRTATPPWCDTSHRSQPQGPGKEGQPHSTGAHRGDRAAWAHRADRAGGTDRENRADDAKGEGP